MTSSCIRVSARTTSPSAASRASTMRRSVDSRGSTSPPSMRAMRGWETSARSASSLCVRSSEVRRSRRSWGVGNRIRPDYQELLIKVRGSGVLFLVGLLHDLDDLQGDVTERAADLALRDALGVLLAVRVEH